LEGFPDEENIRFLVLGQKYHCSVRHSISLSPPKTVSSRTGGKASGV
jgi:hypothetical protein